MITPARSTATSNISSAVKRPLHDGSTDTSHETQLRQVKRRSLRLNAPSPNSTSHPFVDPHWQISPQSAALKVDIPSKPPTQKEETILKQRKAAAKRWESKLQRPMPTASEIKAAYPLKLLRHYKGPADTLPAPIVRPAVQKSARVQGLLNSFTIQSKPSVSLDMPPTGVTVTSPSGPVQQSTPVHVTTWYKPEISKDDINWRTNKTIIQSEFAKELAWKCFSSSDRGKPDWCRSAMMQSGLLSEELVKEHKGETNKLPHWSKYKTEKRSSS